MHNTIEIRPALAADYEAVWQLITELNQKAPDPEAFRRGYLANLTTQGLYYRLAVRGEEVLGLISLHLLFHLHHARWVGDIQELVIMPHARGAGVGKMLLAWAEQQARQADAELLELSSSKPRVDAHRFYRREGFLENHIRFTKPL